MGSLSLRARLTFWYSTVLAATLVLFSLFLFLLLRGNLLTEVDRALEAEAQAVLQEAAVVPIAGTIHVVLPNVDVFAKPGLYLQAVDAGGRIVDRSTNLGDQTLPIPDRIQNTLLRGRPVLTTVTVGGERLRLYAVPLTNQGSIFGVLEVGQSLQTVDRTLARLRLMLVFGSLLTLAVAGGLGLFLARKALDPIARIADEAAEIGESEDFSRRVRYTGPQDEVGRLALTLNQMLARLQGAYRRLSDSLQAQRRFVADASHELRTPLTTIRGNVDLLRQMGDDPQARQEILSDIASEAERLSRLVADLLVLARADAGQGFETRPLPVADLLFDVARQGRLLAREKVTVEVALPEQLLELAVDAHPDYLKQLLLILVDNAVKYTPVGGRVTLSAHREEDEVGIAVADTGPGIPPEELPHIFERFYRGDKARTARGSGLGLAIAHWIAVQHGGNIEVESEPGRGSRFTVWLRAAHGEEEKGRTSS